jgi:hypothetical protein
MKVDHSPLEKHYWNNRSFFVKREDYLTPGGGNKVRRFHAFFQRYPNLKRMVTLSDRGSHTFLISHYFQTNKHHFLFLERKRPKNEYSDRNKQCYKSNENTTVISKSFWKLLLLYGYYRFLCFDPRVKTIGIGGKVSEKLNPSANALEECMQQLEEMNEKGTIIHLFPIASGQMADGFLRVRHARTRHHLFGVMTGDKATLLSLRYKFRKNKEQLTLIRKKNLTPEILDEKAISFYQATGIWVDPIHTVHLLPALEKITLTDKSSKVVLWITCPLQRCKPIYF